MHPHLTPYDYLLLITAAVIAILGTLTLIAQVIL